MCDTCGCNSNHVSLQKPGESKHTHVHEQDAHHHTHSHEKNHEPEHSHNHIHVKVEQDILKNNNDQADLNKQLFLNKNITAFNLVSSPGAGKTTLLEKTIQSFKNGNITYVIEGDQQTMYDAERIEKAGAKAIQINTGTGCHLDANMVNQAFKELDPVSNSLLFIENVGNLVCPALFDLGENHRIVIISVTEGDDKPAKYPYMFESSDICIINKMDLLPYVDFNIQTAKNYAKKLNPKMIFFELSCTLGDGMEEWFNFLNKTISK